MAFFLTGIFVGHDAHEFMRKSALDNTWEAPVIQVVLCLFEILLPAYAHIFSLKFAFYRGLRKDNRLRNHTSNVDGRYSKGGEFSYATEEESLIRKNIIHALRKRTPS